MVFVLHTQQVYCVFWLKKLDDPHDYELSVLQVYVVLRSLVQAKTGHHHLGAGALLIWSISLGPVASAIHLRKEAILNRPGPV